MHEEVFRDSLSAEKTIAMEFVVRSFCVCLISIGFDTNSTKQGGIGLLVRERSTSR